MATATNISIVHAFLLLRLPLGRASSAHIRR